MYLFKQVDPFSVKMTQVINPPVTSTVMVLDDEPVIKALIHKTLMQSNYRVLLFKTEEELLASEQSASASLLLLDINLGDQNGMDVLTRLKANPRYRDMPVIMITTDGRDTTLEKCFALGACDYITKPFQAVILKSRIQSAIDRARKVHALNAEIDALSKERQSIDDENQKYEKRIFALEMAHKELSETTQHLATATWRERQRKDELNAALDELKITKAKVEESRAKILNSINYAQHIQSAFLPSMDAMQQLFSASFTLYLPKDIVSGDFYWCHQAGPLQFIGVFDCTGHGVPGALMSIIGISLLNEIVLTKKIHDVDMVLNLLHDGIYQLLHQGETDNKDGMEATLCCIDRGSSVLNFAGSGIPLIYFKNNECHTVKGSSLTIGGKRPAQEGAFERHVIDLAGIEEVYLFSDGLQDQFGGENNRKMGLKNVLAFLGSIHREPMDVQKSKLQAFLDQWMAAGKRPERQIDDILMIGFRL